jgi:hypothetical protein
MTQVRFTRSLDPKLFYYERETPRGNWTARLSLYLTGPSALHIAEVPANWAAEVCTRLCALPSGGSLTIEV